MRTYRSSLYAALAAAAMAMVLGTLLARTFTRPVRELTTATRAMAQGDLAQSVAVRSQDELGELAAACSQMSADLAQANGLRRQMTADIAHDLRTPLTVIAGDLESMRDGVLRPSQARFEAVRNEAHHCNAWWRICARYRWPMPVSCPSTASRVRRKCCWSGSPQSIGTRPNGKGSNCVFGSTPACRRSTSIRNAWCRCWAI